MGNAPEESHPCPNCGWPNRPGARFCARCSKQLSAAPAPSAIDRIIDDVANGISGFVNQVITGITGPNINPTQPPMHTRPVLQKNGPLTQTAPTSRKIPASSAGPSHPTVPIGGSSHQHPGSLPPRRLRPLNRGEKIGYFHITEVIPVPNDPFLMYYYARWVVCPSCHNPVANIHSPNCASCQRPLPDLLLRQSGAAAIPEDQETTQHLINLSAQGGMPGILPHFTWFVHEDMVYTVLSRPAVSWQPMSSLQTCIPIDMIISWLKKVVEAMDLLHQRGFTLFEDRRQDLRAPFIVTTDHTAFLANLTGCHSIYSSPNPDAEMRRDVAILARLVFFLLTGQGMTGSMAGVNGELRKVFEKARVMGFTSARAFLSEIEHIPPPPVLARGLRQSFGYATDLGIIRQSNEDYVGQYTFALEQTPGAEQIGLFIVADGMGGHEAGERASQDVVRVIVEKIHEQKSAPNLRRSTRMLDQSVTNQDILGKAIARANEVLYEARKAGGSDRGTTLTAAFIVGATATVANIGDSRTYLYHAGRLEQVTRDHSLVASLVAAGQISKEEARHHPNRNQVYRNLGDKLHVEIDFFPINLVPDDMLMLCSDGLWEMLPEKTIENILTRAASPQKACDELIRAANAAGGEDNISVIVIKIE